MTSVDIDYLGPNASGGDSSALVATYWIDGPTSPTDAITAMLQTAPPRLGGLVITNYSVDSETDSLWHGTVNYGTKDLQESSYAFEIGVTSTKMTQSLQTMGRYAPPGETCANFYGAIGVTKDGVEGTDVNIPNFSWTETHYQPKSQMTKAYFFDLFNVTARMNAATFRGFDPGEVLLIGISGSASVSIPKFEMQFKFIALPNAENLTVSNITISEKLGHDYLWVRYKDIKDATANSMVKIPYEVFVERVYEFGDYDALRIDDPF